MKVPIGSINEGEVGAQMRDGLDYAVVEQYAQATDLPPIVVYDTPDKGRVMADGWHRLAAARRRGETSIEADVRSGSAEEAVIVGIMLNTHHGKPLTAEERIRAIVRLSELGKTQREISALTGASMSSVFDALSGAKVSGGSKLPLRVTRVIGRAPEAMREALTKRAIEQGWSGEQTQAVVNALPAAAGTYSSAPADPRQVIDMAEAFRDANEAARKDPLAALMGAMAALALAKARFDAGMFDDLDRQRRLDIDSDSEEYIAFLRKVQRMVMGTRTPYIDSTREATIQ